MASIILYSLEKERRDETKKRREERRTSHIRVEKKNNMDNEKNGAHIQKLPSLLATRLTF